MFKCKQLFTKRSDHNKCREGSEGQTTISVTDASVFSIGDLVNFGETDGHEYEVTTVNDSGSSDTIVIKLKDNVNGEGLQSTISSGTNIRRRWRFYDLFDGIRHINICN